MTENISRVLPNDTLWFFSKLLSALEYEPHIV
jgi:hypothetical protein